MEQLPYIDEHSILIGATREGVWQALTSTLGSGLGKAVQSPLVRLLRVAPSETRGDWEGAIHPGDTLPGFAVREVDAPKRLVLCGGHRFSRYVLVFELEATGPARCTLRALTWAAFRGLTGRTYRALVIGSRGHRVVVKQMLREVASRA